MYPFLALNLAIVALAAICVVSTGNPLFVLLLVLLRDMPAFPPQRMLDHERAAMKANASNAPYQTNAVGFTGFVGGGNDDEDFQDRGRTRR